jgi:hypothetical protein
MADAPIKWSYSGSHNYIISGGISVTNGAYFLSVENLLSRA